MGIKKLVKASFFIIVALFIFVGLVNNISLYKIRENNISKNNIFKIVSIQENMNQLMLDAILVTNLEQLSIIEKNFSSQEKKFENIKDLFFKNDKDDILDRLLTDLHHYPVIKRDLKILFSNEKSIEDAFEQITKLQEEKIKLNKSFETLYPLENDTRKHLQLHIWNTNDVSTIKKFSDLRYYSKEALYQHRDEKRLNNWIEIAKYLKDHTKNKDYEEYLNIVYQLKDKILQINKIEEEENQLIKVIQNVLLVNRKLNSSIEVSSENILNNFIYTVNLFMITISAVIILFILFVFYKVNKNVGLSVDEIQKRIDDGLKEIKNLNSEIEQTQKEVVFTMGAIGESRSKETGNHVKRVAEYSKLLALYYGLPQKEAEMLKQASPMHDIGKVAIPDAILNKPGRFDEAEREIMNTHSQLGYDMLKHSNRPLLKCAATVAYEHHEKWDGTGYPRKLKGEEIHIYGRITALADVFDALGSDRCYKKAWDDERIFNLFKEERGKHFDPKLIDIFFEHLDEFLKIRDKFKDI
jgi:HD-GYP domain-containing protein (c-di-GMP phosphodiesterase class II)